MHNPESILVFVGQTVPWFAIDNGEDTFFAGLMWSGGWSLTAERSNAGIELTLGLAPMATSVTSAVDGFTDVLTLGHAVTEDPLH